MKYVKQVSILLGLVAVVASPGASASDGKIFHGNQFKCQIASHCADFFINANGLRNNNATFFRNATLPIIKDNGSLTNYDVTIFFQNAGGTVCFAYAFDIGTGSQVGVGLTIDPAPGAPNQRSRSTITTNWAEINSITCAMAPGATLIGVNYNEKP